MMTCVWKHVCRYWPLMSWLLIRTNAHAALPAVPADSGRTGTQLPVAWPIDTKVEAVLQTINTTILTKGPMTKSEQQRRQQQFLSLFAPSGYFVVLMPNKTERWVSASQFLAQLNPARGVHYELKTAKVIHFQAVSRNKKGEYSSRAVIYFDVTRFDNHLPVTRTTSRVMIPLAQTPPAADYWQIYELKVVEVSNSISSAPR